MCCTRTATIKTCYLVQCHPRSLESSLGSFWFQGASAWLEMKRLFRSCFSAGCAFFASHLLHKIKAPAILLILFIPWPEYRTFLRSCNSSPGHIARLFLNFFFVLLDWQGSEWTWANVCSFWLAKKKKEVCVFFWLPCHNMAVVAASCASIAKALPNFSAVR